jgi:hypothetical protein
MKILALGALALFAAVLLAGCPQPKPPYANVPSDLEITYSYGACHAEWGRTNIIIDAGGNGVYESGSGSLLPNGRFSEEKFHKTFSINESELLGLLNSIEASGFYSLNEHYTDINIQDGGCEYISVTKSNVTKSVSVANTNPPEAYSKVAGMVGALAENKTK